MNASINAAREVIARNCHIADARHGAELGMCTYLMKMREYYRWEQGVGVDAPLPKDELGDWLMAREALWESLGNEDYLPIPAGGEQIDPFDADALNAYLEPHGLIYSAGLVNGARANFFLGRLASSEERTDGFQLRISDKEWVRCLNSPPAMTQGRTIYLRQESLYRYLWEKYQAWGWRRADNALGKAFAYYPFGRDNDAALTAMTESEMAAMRAHELGEYRAGQLLGEAWNAMLLDLALTPVEIMARAVRDYLADSWVTLPQLLEEGRDASIHFFIGNIGAMRKMLAPALQEAYRRWLETGDAGFLREWTRRGQDHWSMLAEEMLMLHRRDGRAALPVIKELVERSTL